MSKENTKGTGLDLLNDPAWLGLIDWMAGAIAEPRIEKIQGRSDEEENYESNLAESKLRVHHR